MKHRHKLNHPVFHTYVLEEEFLTPLAHLVLGEIACNLKNASAM
jgi:hypothetical protein